MKQRITSVFQPMAFAALTLALSTTVMAQCDEVFISEYIEGWSNNKAIEIFNPTNDVIDLSFYQLERYSNGATTSLETQKIALSGNIHPDSAKVFVLDKQDPDGTGFEAPVWGELADAADVWLCPVYAENDAMYFNGNDAMVLRNNCTGDPVDIFGKIGENPGDAGWDGMTQNHTLVRRPEVTSGDIGAIDDFVVEDEWLALPWLNDTIDDVFVSTLDSVFVNLGSHTCDCGSVVPSQSADDCVTNGVEAVRLVEGIQLFPNPATGDVVWVKSASRIESMAIHNMSGQQLMTQSSNASRILEVDLSALPQGVYFMTLQLGQGLQVTRRVVRK